MTCFRIRTTRSLMCCLNEKKHNLNDRFLEKFQRKCWEKTFGWSNVYTSTFNSKPSPVPHGHPQYPTDREPGCWRLDVPSPPPAVAPLPPWLLKPASIEAEKNLTRGKPLLSHVRPCKLLFRFWCTQILFSKIVKTFHVSRLERDLYKELVMCYWLNIHSTRCWVPLLSLIKGKEASNSTLNPEVTVLWKMLAEYTPKIRHQELNKWYQTTSLIPGLKDINFLNYAS